MGRCDAALTYTKLIKEGIYFNFYKTGLATL